MSSQPADVWQASDYGPTAARLLPVAKLLANRVAQIVPSGAHVVDLGAGQGEMTRALLDLGYRVTAERLGPKFGRVTVELADLAWNFDCVDDGMDLYLNGSPTHKWSLDNAGHLREQLLAALRSHLEENAGPDGAITATTGYGIITAYRQASV